MTTAAPIEFHIALSVATHEVLAASAGIQLAFSCVQKCSPRNYDLSLTLHEKSADLLSVPKLDCALLSAANESAEIPADEIVHTWAERVQALGNRNIVALMLNQFRCVDRNDPSRADRLFRIRELNRAQITLAQKHDIILVDIDCILADLGAFNLGCDYLLNSIKGREAAANVIAHAMLSSGLRNKVDEHCLDEGLKMLGGISEWRAALGNIRDQRRNEKHG